MNITLIAAMANKFVIGQENTLPWSLPEDLKHFREQTMGKAILMGRKTFDSIGKALPGRRNIVITADPNFNVEGVERFSSVVSALVVLRTGGNIDELMVIGGGSIYHQFICMASKMVLTRIDLDIPGDAYFPEWDAGEWDLHSTTQQLRSGDLKYTIETYHRK